MTKGGKLVRVAGVVEEKFHGGNCEQERKMVGEETNWVERPRSWTQRWVASIRRTSSPSTQFGLAPKGELRDRPRF